MCHHVYCFSLPNYLPAVETVDLHVFGPFYLVEKYFINHLSRDFCLFLTLRPNKNKVMVTGYLPVISDVGVIRSRFVYFKWKSLHKAAFWAFTKKEASVGLLSQLLLSETLEALLLINSERGEASFFLTVTYTGLLHALNPQDAQTFRRLSQDNHSSQRAKPWCEEPPPAACEDPQQQWLSQWHR